MSRKVLEPTQKLRKNEINRENQDTRIKVKIVLGSQYVPVVCIIILICNTNKIHGISLKPKLQVM